MGKFIEVDVANTDSKTLVNIDQIVNVGRYRSDDSGYISFNSSGGNYENCIHTKQSYEDLKSLILSAKLLELDVESNKTDVLSFDDLQKRVKELELINFDSELHFDAAKEHIDRLQKRIDDAWRWCEKGCILKAMAILKGEETK